MWMDEVEEWTGASWRTLGETVLDKDTWLEVLKESSMVPQRPLLHHFKGEGSRGVHLRGHLSRTFVFNYFHHTAQLSNEINQQKIAKIVYLTYFYFARPWYGDSYNKLPPLYFINKE
nr:hypothetical protein BgiMline_016954 [Biomphalaria glabrata]